ncbi:zinc-dependent metalloprotease family protein [Streptomyces sp. NPDC058579]|uniref:zinc-dependent metalloprotease family protein n=1 Tax=Streptomyces sp. NPDC058579 TaxID=3346548 RepID=UPI00365CD133
MLVLYSPQAAQDAGGPDAVREIADAAVEFTNLALVQSQAKVRTRIVAVAPAPDYNPTGADERDAAYDYVIDPPASAVQLRDAHRADVTAVIASDVGGFAMAPSSRPLPVESPGAGPRMLLGQDLTRREPDVLAHEFGHLLGLEHDGYADGDHDPGDGYLHARGYVAPSLKWRDIMAYENKCTDAGAECPVIPYFSNPRLTYQGEPLGVPIGQPGQADAVSMLDESAPVVANYR